MRQSIWVFGVLTLCVGSGVCQTVSPGPDALIYACVSRFDGFTRILPRSGDCVKEFEQSLEWNEPGVPGAAGAAGPQGPMGAMGLPGAPGPVGAQGQHGPQGAAGPVGAVGPQGVTGTNGPQGATGPTGPQGPSGPTGLPGATGAQGPAATFSGYGFTANSGLYYGSGGLVDAVPTSVTNYLPLIGNGVNDGPKDAVHLPNACVLSDFSIDFVATYEFNLPFSSNPPQTKVGVNVSSVAGQVGTTTDLCTLQLNNQGHLACTVPGPVTIPAGYATYAINFYGGFYIQNATILTSFSCQ